MQLLWKKKFFFPVLILVVLVLGALVTFFVLTKQSDIKVINQNPSYKVTYRQTKLFTYYLDAWQLLNEGDEKISVAIFITDTPPNQALYKLNTQPNSSEMLIAANIEVKNNTKNIYIFLDKQLQQVYTKDILEEQIAGIVIKMLAYDPNQKNPNPDGAEIINAVTGMKDNQDQLPFIVTYKE